MPVKMTGAQYKAFMEADWGPDAMREEAEITINGEPVPEDFCDDERTLMKDGDLITVSGGVLYPDQTGRPRHFIDAERFARKWLKDQSVVTLLVEVPREYSDQIAKLIAENGVNNRMAKVVGRLS